MKSTEEERWIRLICRCLRNHELSHYQCTNGVELAVPSLIIFIMSKGICRQLASHLGGLLERVGGWPRVGRMDGYLTVSRLPSFERRSLHPSFASTRYCAEGLSVRS